MRIEKPWGYEIIWATAEKYIGKILHINAGHSLSLQYHNVKEETIRVLSGELYFYHEDKTHIMKPGDCFHIKPKEIHRMVAGESDVEIIEVSTPELDDVVRLKDAYGRVPICGAV